MITLMNLISTGETISMLLIVEDGTKQVEDLRPTAQSFILPMSIPLLVILFLRWNQWTITYMSTLMDQIMMLITHSIFINHTLLATISQKDTISMIMIHTTNQTITHFLWTKFMTNGSIKSSIMLMMPLTTSDMMAMMLQDTTSMSLTMRHHPFIIKDIMLMDISNTSMKVMRTRLRIRLLMMARRQLTRSQLKSLQLRSQLSQLSQDLLKILMLRLPPRILNQLPPLQLLVMLRQLLLLQFIMDITGIPTIAIMVIPITVIMVMLTPITEVLTTIMQILMTIMEMLMTIMEMLTDITEMIMATMLMFIMDIMEMITITEIFTRDIMEKESLVTTGRLITTEDNIMEMTTK